MKSSQEVSEVSRSERRAREVSMVWYHTIGKYIVHRNRRRALANSVGTIPYGFSFLPLSREVLLFLLVR